MKTTNKKILPALLWIVILMAAAMLSKAVAQEKYFDKNAVVIFEASEKLFEEVKATNSSATAIFDSKTNQIAALALMKGFRFKNSLMEEHFNENYIESSAYPKATFRGELIDLDFNDLGAEETKVRVKGILKIRGKEKEIETELTLLKVAETISMTGQFVVSPSDFDIEIPKIVRNKIAKNVQVNLDFKLVKK